MGHRIKLMKECNSPQTVTLCEGWNVIDRLATPFSVGGKTLEDSNRFNIADDCIEE